MLDHEKLDVYQVSIEFMAIAIKITDNIPRGYSSLADQLKRAAWSIPLNIAEGCGKSTVNDKRRFYVIARGSAMECGAIIDVCRVLEIDDMEALKQGKDLLVRVVSMLTKLCQFC
ncbi:four helix bundle protein [Desulfobacter latus]|nr:four helix bundle protein [Desulfobacter latus]